MWVGTSHQIGSVALCLITPSCLLLVLRFSFTLYVDRDEFFACSCCSIRMGAPVIPAASKHSY